MIFHWWSAPPHSLVATYCYPKTVGFQLLGERWYRCFQPLPTCSCRGPVGSGTWAVNISMKFLGTLGITGTLTEFCYGIWAMQISCKALGLIARQWESHEGKRIWSKEKAIFSSNTQPIGYKRPNQTCQNILIWSFFDGSWTIVDGLRLPEWMIVGGKIHCKIGHRSTLSPFKASLFFRFAHEINAYQRLTATPAVLDNPPTTGSLSNCDHVKIISALLVDLWSQVELHVAIVACLQIVLHQERSIWSQPQLNRAAKLFGLTEGMEWH